jgi:poly(3-hydroxybutyrate) depolymerase
MPIQHTLHFQRDEREYFIQHPRNIDPNKTYLLLIVVHGGGGNGKFYWLANGIKKAMEDQPIDAIIVTLSYTKKH